MNHTRNTKSLAFHGYTWGACMILLTMAVAWFSGCADPRTEPLRSPDPGYSETLTLWQDASSNGQMISTTFSVARELAPIVNPIEDTPARLTLWAYIAPDGDIVWMEAIINDSIPPRRDQIIEYLIQVDQLVRHLDSLIYFDSLCTANPDTCDSTTYDDEIAATEADTAALNALVAGVVADTTALGARRDSLAAVVDNRFALTLWLDNDTTAAYPEAVFVNSELMLGGQEIYLADTDTTSGYKARRFQVDLNSFESADANHLGLTLEVNWTTCFPGSTRPCLSPGDHTLHARLTGADTRITATLVLVYGDENP